MKKSACIIVLALLLFITGLSQVAGIPREETLIVDVLSGRAGSPGNFNVLRLRGVILIEAFNN